jgi:lysophospholipase L1-like esterase
MVSSVGPSRSAVILGLLGLVLSFGVLEGGLRLYAEARAGRFVGAAVPTDDTVPDRLLVAWHKANYQAPDGISYDSLGFRTNGAARETPGTRPIVVLGGSTAFGWGTSDTETIEAVLEGRLRTAGQPDAVVINAGFPGLTTLDTLAVYQSRVASLRPSTVIVLAGLNDLYYAVDWLPDSDKRLRWTSRTYELGLRARNEPSLRPLVDAITRFALGNCFTCYALGAGSSQIYDRTGFLPALTLSERLGQPPLGNPNHAAMQLTAWGVGELARRVQADGGCLVVAWQPMAGVPSGAHSASEQVALDRVALNAPRWPAVAPQMFADLLNASRPIFAAGLAEEVNLTATFDSAAEKVFVEDGVHYTPDGNRRLAEALEAALASNAC